MSISPIVASGSISDDWSGVFLAEEDGGRFQEWSSRLVVEVARFKPAIAPAHLAMRFRTFADGLAFFRERYGPTA